MQKQEMLRQLADFVTSQRCSHPLRVGINGIDGAGKTHLADQLTKVITDRNVIRASIDGFHNPKAIRYARGRWSAEGYYYDSFDNEKFIDALFNPLGMPDNMTYQTAAFDHKKDSVVQIPTKKHRPMISFSLMEFSFSGLN